LRNIQGALSESTFQRLYLLDLWQLARGDHNTLHSSSPGSMKDGIHVNVMSLLSVIFALIHGVRQVRPNINEL
jgi:hypothetical protein